MKPTVFIPERIASQGVDLLREHCVCVTPWEEGIVVPTNLVAAESAFHLTAFQKADAVLVRLFEIRAVDLENAPRLRVIAKHGVGVDNIDCKAATSRGTPVLYTPGSNSQTVAEHTMALMLSLSRNIYPSSHAMRKSISGC